MISTREFKYLTSIAIICPYLNGLKYCYLIINLFDSIHSSAQLNGSKYSYEIAIIQFLCAVQRFHIFLSNMNNCIYN